MPPNRPLVPDLLNLWTNLGNLLDMKKVQMEEELSRKYTARLCRKGIIEEGYAEIYEYGFELLISSVISVVLTVAIGVILHAGWFAVGYLVGLIPVRIYAGGYHARTHIECNIVFELLFTGSVIISNFLQYRYSTVIGMYICLFAVLCRYAPLEAKNKPLTELQSRKYRTYALIISLVFMVIDIYGCSLESSLFRGMLFGKLGVIVLILIQVACDMLANMSIDK